MEAGFRFDDRLGIPIPDLQDDWESYPRQIREQYVARWEEIRGRIPERVKRLEEQINRKQAELNVENHFPRSCALNSEIAELASIINDLHLWYRIDQDVTDKRMHG